MAAGLTHAIHDLVVFGRSYFDLHREKDKWSRTLGSAHRKMSHDWYWQFGKVWNLENPFPEFVAVRISSIGASDGMNKAEKEQVLLTHDFFDRTWDLLHPAERKYWEAFFVWLLLNPDLLRSWAGVDVVKGRIRREKDGWRRWHACPALRGEYRRLLAYAGAVRSRDPQLRHMLKLYGKTS